VSKRTMTIRHFHHW